VRRYKERVVFALVLINVLLQLADGIATYALLRAGLAAEVNPLMGAVIEYYGVGPTVCIGKFFVIALIGLVWPLRGSPFAAPALLFVGTFYAVIALLPWATAMAS
jgi:Domain of unknown function (DUF5658)